MNNWKQLKTRYRPMTELGLVGLWAVWVGRAFLDFNPAVWPVGNEWGQHLQPYYFWAQLQSCGLCALWNGGINGGTPALSDLLGSTLHPLIMIPALLWGVSTGARISVVAALWLAGAAQWWIARTLRLGPPARIWSALIAVVAGNLLAPMDAGEIALVVATATGGLTLAAALNLGITGQRRAALWLALAGALFILAGQFYPQLSLLSWSPALLFFLLDKRLRLRPMWKEFALATGLSVLLAGVFLVPALHFLPNFAKSTDPQFIGAQTMEYSPLNLVIRDWAFLHTQILGKLPYPTPLYIGWAPVLLAIVCLRFARRPDHAALLYLGVGAGLMFFVASAIPLRWFVELVPALAGFRHSILLAALAVPGILGLAAYGLHHLWNANWPRLVLYRPSNPATSAPTPIFNLAWLLLIPLAWSLRISYDFGRSFLRTQDARQVYAIVKQLPVSGLQWVGLPSGEHYWIIPALEQGLKLTDVTYPSNWKGRANPQRQLAVVRSETLPGAELIGTVADLFIYQFPQVEYAYVDSGDGQHAPCQASGGSGQIQVECDTPTPGSLVVQENAWSGWWAWRDGTRLPLSDGRWLRLDAPAGKHRYLLRYLPWDVPLGLVVTLTGAFLYLRLWRGTRSTLA